MGDLVKFDFRGVSLDVIPGDEETELWVSIKRVAEALGIDAWTQQEKLRSKAWATTRIIPAVAGDGKKREMECIHVDSLPMWMATIEASKVAEHLRATLEAFQLECAGCRAQFDSRRPCPRCSAFAQRKPWRHEDLR